MPSSRPDRLDLDLAVPAQPRLEGHRPRRVDAPAPRREEAEPPVAHLVARALEDERAVVGQGAGGLLLLLEVGDEVLRGERVEVVLLPQSLARASARGAWPISRVRRPMRAAELDGPRAAVGLPERHLARLARRGHDEHAVAGDLGDAPGGGAEDEHLADAALEHHLLVELAHAPAAALAVGEEDAVEPAVGDRAGVRDRQLLRALARAHRPAQPVPDDARAQLGELVGGIAAGEHVEDALEGRAREVREGRRPADEREEVVDAPLAEGHRRDEVLREDVEGVARHARLLDGALLHRLRDRGTREEVAAVLREDDAARDGVDLVARPADPLHAARDGRRRLDLHDEVDRPHVDAELERRGRDDRREASGLERVLDLERAARGRSSRGGRGPRPRRRAR